MNLPQVLKPQSFSVSIAKPIAKEVQSKKEKMESSSTIIFSLVNATIGSNIILLPLSVANSGLGLSLIVAIIIGFVSYKTCQLTHLHTKPEETDFIPTVHRILGKKTMLLYSSNSVILLFLCCIIYFLSLSDVTYSCLKLITNSKDWPSRDEMNFGTFSFQYVGLILMAIIGWAFFIEKIGLIVEISGKGVYAILVECLFAIYVGVRALIQGEVNFEFYSDDDTSVGLFTSNSYTKTIGAFAMAFMVHNSVVDIVKRNKNQANNVRDVRTSSIITFFAFTISGLVGATGIYSKMHLNPNTVLSNEVYEGRNIAAITVLVITQIMTALQLVTVLCLNANVLREQFFILFLGEHRSPPRWAKICFNFFVIGCLLVTQILNVSPGVVMSYGGAIFGFVIIYYVPIRIHFKELRARQILDRNKYASLHEHDHHDHHDHDHQHENHEKSPQIHEHHEGSPTMNEHQDEHHDSISPHHSKLHENDHHHGSHDLKESEITKFIMDKHKINYKLEYGFYGGIFLVGVYIFVAQILSFFT